MQENDPRLHTLFKLISILRSRHCSVKQLAEKVQSSESTMCQYLEQLNDAGFQIETDLDECYFISTHYTLEQLINEEFAFMSLLVQPDPEAPFDVSAFRKISDHLEGLVDQLTKSMRNRRQVILHEHVASNVLQQRLVEPIHFSNTHNSVMVLDTYDLKCKQVPLYCVRGLTETNNPFIHQVLHGNNTTDMFGMKGEPTIWITLGLHEHAYFYLQQEYPLSIPYLSYENNGYLFHGPVATFAGIGRFVLEMLHLVEIEGPEEFMEYVWRKTV